jgi:hypothetical protein
MVAGGLALGAVMTNPSVAQAQDVGLELGPTCLQGDLNVGYDPPLTLHTQPTTVTMTGEFTCIPLPVVASGNEIRKARLEAHGQANYGCVLGGATARFTVIWQDENSATVGTSVFEGRAVVNTKPDGIAETVATGRIVEGDFLGYQVENTYVGLANPLECLSGGVKSSGGQSSLTVNKLPLSLPSA